jgi:hypothetical protein
MIDFVVLCWDGYESQKVQCESCTYFFATSKGEDELWIFLGKKIRTKKKSAMQQDTLEAQPLKWIPFRYNRRLSEMSGRNFFI